MANRQKLIHLHTSENRAPVADDLHFGEIAVMHNEEAQALYIKTGNSGSQTNAVVKFITEDAVKSLISGATNDFVALKTEVSALSTLTEGATEALQDDVDFVSGEVKTLQDSVVTAVTVNGQSATVTDNAASVEIDTDDVKVGTAITYGQTTLATTSATATEAMQALANKIESIDGVVSESNHGHTNKDVLDGISAAKVDNWDNAFASAHTHDNKALLDTYTQTEANLADAVSKKHEHSNKAELDLIQSGDVAKWNAISGLTNKVDVEEGKGLSTNDYTDAEKEKLAGVANGAQVNVIDTVKVNGTALTVTNKAVDILVAEGTANGTVKVNGVDVNVHGLGSAAYADTTAFDAAGAATTVKTELIGDMTGATKTLGGLEDRIDALTTGSNVSISTATTTEGYLKSYTFSQNGATIGTIDIPKDLVVTSGEVVEVSGVKYLRLTIANQQAPVDIAVSDLVDVYTEGNGIEISTGNVISAKVVAGNGLSLDSNGIAMAAASSNGAGAMSASDFDKLAGIATGAQANVLEGVQVNGADLTPDANKKVNVTITTGTSNGTIAVNGSNVAVTGLGSAAYANTTAFDAAGAAEAASGAAITAVVGDMTGSTKTLGALQDAIEGLHVGDDNVLEGVQVNGTDLSISNKKVNVTVAEGSTNGTIAVNNTDVAVHGLGSAAYENASAFDAAGTAATEAATASGAAVTAVVGNASASGSTLGALEGRMDNMDLGDHNVIEEVQVNGTALSVSNKAVNVTVAEGSTNGTIAVNGTDVSVHGLGTAAYQASTAFDAAGAADAVLGTAQDNSGATTVYGVKAYAAQLAADAQATANGAVQGIESGKDNGVTMNANNELDFTGINIDCGEY